MYRLLNYKFQISFFYFIYILLISFFLIGCNKKISIPKNEICFSMFMQVSPNKNLKYFNAFNQKYNPSDKCNKCILDPAYYEIKLESGSVAIYNGKKMVKYVVKDSPFSYTKWNRNAILVKKNAIGKFKFSNLIYLADSSFYAAKQYKPLSINFTGVVLEFNQESKLIKAFSYDFGTTIDVLNEREIKEYFRINNNLDFYKLHNNSSNFDLFLKLINGDKIKNIEFTEDFWNYTGILFKNMFSTRKNNKQHD